MKQLFILIGLAASSTAAYAGPILYGVDYPQSATLYSVDQSSGAISAIGAVGLDNIGDLTSDQASTLYGVQITTNSLVTIDPTTGAGTLGPAITGTALDANGAEMPIVSLAFDPLTDILYGNTSVPYGNATVDQLYSIDTTTGVASAIGSGIGEISVYALAFSQDGNLFGVDSNDNLIQISTTTGAGTVIGSTGLSAVFDLASRPGDGTMFAADSGTTSLYTVDLSTGATSLVGAYGSDTNIVGLAFLDATAPEPGSIFLMITGFGVLGFIAYRRNSRATVR